MKPSKLHIPLNEKSSSFFSSPYDPNRTRQLSPIPDNSPLVTGAAEKTGSSSSSSEADADVQTPLLPPTPSMTMMEGGGSYPFPSEGPSSWSRFRAVGRTGMPAGMVKRVLCLVAVLGAGLLVLHHTDSGISLPTKYLPTSTKHQSQNTHIDDDYDYIPPQKANSKKPAFKFPFSSSKPAHHSSDRPSIYVDADAQGRREIDIASEPLPVAATLRERLDAWREAPGGRGEVEGEVEMGGFVQWNLEQCDTIHEQHNTHMIQKSANVWAVMNRTTLHDYRMELINHMEDVLAAGLTEQYGQGRGIVMVAGNADTLQRVKWSLQMLRSYESKLPVQIYHFPSERPNDDDPIRDQLRELGAELVEAVGQEKDKGKNKSYHLKALAVVQCPWREILYLDSDSIPTRDPEYMFDAPNYQRLGLWATPDYWKTSANNPIWAIMGVKCRNEWEMETGQMFVDKKLHLDVFLLIQYMLENHEWWFYFSDGDKDIFRWAMLALRKRWGVPGRWVGAAALPSGTASGDFCSHTMLQHDSWGQPLFVHYNLLKQIPSGVGRGYSWGRTKQLPLFNLWPASPATARLGEPEKKPEDDDRRGLGDVDCDMLADADESGNARSDAKEMIKRRAARERGVKVRYHGGWISALCIDLDYIDPRPQSRKDADAARKEKLEAAHQQNEADNVEEGERPAFNPFVSGVGEGEEFVGTVYPNWEQSPIEVVQWKDDEHLAGFEKKIYDYGFKPSGPGF